VIVGVTSWGTSQFCRSGQSGFQRLDDADARGFYEPLLAEAASRLSPSSSPGAGAIRRARRHGEAVSASSARAAR
jgi:hypothetical protein